jgi:hypothetical protein
MLTEDSLGIVPPGHNQLALIQIEHAPPRQQESGFLVPKHDLADVDEPLEGLALLKLGLAVFIFKLLARQTAPNFDVHRGGVFVTET